MRLQRVVPAFAAAIALAGSAAPAYGFHNRASGAGATDHVTRAFTVAHQQGGSSSALLDLGVGAVAGMAIGSLGLAAVTRRSTGTRGRAGGIVTGRS